MAPSDEAELIHMVATAAAIDDRPSAIRYPRGEGTGVARPAEGVPLEIGKGRIVKRRHRHRHPDLRHPPDRKCCWRPRSMAGYGLSPTIADARFAKPLDTDLIRRLAREHEVLITIEEGAVGRLRRPCDAVPGADGLLDRGLKIRPMTLPDVFQDQDSPRRCMPRRAWMPTASCARR